jgi:hypothetical protein
VTRWRERERERQSAAGAAAITRYRNSSDTMVSNRMSPRAVWLCATTFRI